MSKNISLAETSSLLGVTKTTIRNWDKTGRLKSIRNQKNNYREYAFDDVIRLKNEISKSNYNESGLKNLISKINNTIRDNESSGEILWRFDEISKIFLVIISGAYQDNETDFVGGNKKQFSEYIRKQYKNISSKVFKGGSNKFQKIFLKDETIFKIGNHLKTIPKDELNFDTLGIIYQELIKSTFDKNENQQFFTPHQIVKFMVDFYVGQSFKKVCDPASGTGGFLVEFLKSKSKYKYIKGFEIDERLAWITSINMHLMGAKNAISQHIFDGGILGNIPTEERSKYDLILTNPPFGSNLTEKKYLNSFVLGKKKSSRRRGILFIERCWELLKDKGSMAIVVDEGILNQPSTSDVRKFILDNFEIRAIISLPETAFMPYATVKSSILFLEKTKKPKQKNTFFASVNNIGRKNNGDDDIVFDDNFSPSLNNELPIIMDMFLKKKKVAKNDVCYWSEIERIPNDSDFEPILDFKFNHPSKKQSEEILKTSKYKIFKLSELCEEIKNTSLISKEFPDTIIQYTSLSSIESRTGKAVQIPTISNSIKSAVKRYEPGDIVFSKMRPSLRKCSLMLFKEGGYISPECSVLRVKKENGKNIIDPNLLCILLRSDFIFGQINHLVKGIGRPRINLKDLMSIKIPKPSAKEQKIITNKYIKKLKKTRSALKKAETIIFEAKNYEQVALKELEREISG